MEAIIVRALIFLTASFQTNPSRVAGRVSPVSYSLNLIHYRLWQKLTYLLQTTQLSSRSLCPTEDRPTAFNMPKKTRNCIILSSRNNFHDFVNTLECCRSIYYSIPWHKIAIVAILTCGFSRYGKKGVFSWYEANSTWYIVMFTSCHTRGGPAYWVLSRRQFACSPGWVGVVACTYTRSSGMHT